MSGKNKKLIREINFYVVIHNLLLKQILENKIHDSNKHFLKRYKSKIDSLRGELYGN